MTSQHKNPPKLSCTLVLTLLGSLATTILLPIQSSLPLPFIEPPSLLEEESPLVRQSLENVSLQSTPSTSNTSNSVSTLQSYNSSIFPVFPNFDPGHFPIRVGVVAGCPPRGIGKHMILDGAMNSDVLQFVGAVCLINKSQENSNFSTAASLYSSSPLHPSDAQLWIVLFDGEAGTNNGPKGNFITTLLQSEKPTWKVLLLKYCDRYERIKKHVLARPHIRAAHRSIVIDRYYDSNLATEKAKSALVMNIPVIVPGHIVENPGSPPAGAPILHAPYAVRSDIATALDEEHQRQVSACQVLENVSIAERERPLDVVHFWQATAHAGSARLRNDVSNLVESWHGTRTYQDGRFWNVSAKIEGERNAIGRNTVNLPYIQTLLSAKIVLVTQRDRWEDHFRLFEALVSGTLVIHDKMLAPPSGLQHGVNILSFETFQELEQLVTHYLQNDDQRIEIACKGRALALERHRSWHRIEQLVFGQEFTSAP